MTAPVMLRDRDVFRVGETEIVYVEHDETAPLRGQTGVLITPASEATQIKPEATIVADLTHAPHIPSDAFDCIIFTQSLQMIVDMGAALATLHRILKPGGMLLLTTSGISKVGRRLGRDDWGEYWRLTAQGVEVLAKQYFPGAEVEVIPYGNVLTAVAYLEGLSLEELEPAELDYVDPDYEVIVAARIRKARAA